MNIDILSESLEKKASSIEETYSLEVKALDDQSFLVMLTNVMGLKVKARAFSPLNAFRKAQLKMSRLIIANEPPLLEQ
jgi:hypothetical protein